MYAEANHPVRTTKKSLALLEELLELDGARISGLSKNLEMTKGSIHKHLSTLRETNYVVKDEETDVYRVGLKSLTMGGKVRGQYDIYEYARPKIDRVADETGHLANLMIEENGLGAESGNAQMEVLVSVLKKRGTMLIRRCSAS